MALPKYGKHPNLYCRGQRAHTDAFREGHERTFGRKPLPHGKDRLRDFEKTQPQMRDEVEMKRE